MHADGAAERPQIYFDKVIKIRKAQIKVPFESFTEFQGSPQVLQILFYLIFFKTSFEDNSMSFWNVKCCA